MDRFQRRELIDNAKGALSGATYSPGKLLLIHTGVSSALALLLALLSFLLEQQIAGTTGLGGIGTRAVLESAQSFLELVNMVLLPFWSVGLLRTFMYVGRLESAQPRDLLEGFRCFGPVLRGKLLQVLVLMGASFLGCYLGMFLYTMTPMSAGLVTSMEPYMTETTVDYTALMEDPAFLQAAMWALPFMLGMAAVFVVPLYYRLRLMDYFLMDRPEKGALHAMRSSKAVMRGKRWELFRLDLHFWWFYGLEALVAALCYGDVLLAMLGVDLGVSATVAFFLFYALALVAQLGLYVWKKPLLLTAYARYYDAVRPKPQHTVYPPMD